ncbi:YfhO family protein [Kallotenue papyrolyticum]|uniref:YfhO family protein n=1 Tax=Kallotenue papyrolyticum TaxID=1325125 RepID=UPI0013780D8F|nr:YfhO family protein [Kallotenue papyrolyticum]
MKRRRAGGGARLLRHSDGLVALALVALPLLLFWRVTLGREVFYLHDVQYYFYPYHKLVADTLRAGDLPLWNPYAFSGMPLLGDGQTAIFFAPNWLFLVLPPMHALSLIAVLHLGLAGAGMWAYARALGLSRLAALAGALAYMANGFLVARVVHLSIMAGAALIPLVFWSVERLLQRPARGRLVLVAGCLALQLLSGHPQVPIYTALALALYVLVVAAQRWWRARHGAAWLPLLLLPVAYLLAGGLAAVQLLPWIELARFSPRAAGAGYAFVTAHALRGWDWLLWLFPYGYGGPRESWWQALPATPLPAYLWERLAYVGLLPLALALLAVVGRLTWRSVPHSSALHDEATGLDRRWALLLALVVLVLIAVGAATPVGRLVYALPLIGRLRAYARAVSVVCFALAALAAYGLDDLRRRRVRRGAVTGVALALPGVVGGVLLVAALTPPPPLTSDAPPSRVMAGQALRWPLPNAFLPLLLALLSAALLLAARRRLTPRLGLLMIALIGIDVFGLALSFNPTTTPAVFERVPPSVRWLRRDQDLFRTASFVVEDVLPPATAQAQLAISWAMAYGFEEINGFNSLQPRRYTDVLFGPDVEDVSYGFLGDGRLLCPGHTLLSMLNVRYALIQPDTGIDPRRDCGSERVAPAERDAFWTRVYSDTNVAIYRNPQPHPRAYAARWVRSVPDAHAILAALRQPGFDPRLALVEDGLTPAQAAALSGPGAARIELRRPDPNALVLEVTSDAPRLIVLSEMWFPGWQATLHGRRVPILRVNYLFRGVVVPAGRHTVEMRYRPLSAQLGVALSGLTLVGLVGLCCGGRPLNGSHPPLLEWLRQSGAGAG